jgi:glycosyltransferase involved in cell wall biosynthesis
MKMPDTPKISIITCFLNMEQYIQETIESVLKQDYSNWELLLVDDGSTDKSTGIAKKFASEYPDKIIYCEHEDHSNKGLSASRNYGIKQAKGEFIVYLDADDVWLPQNLSNQVSIFEKNKHADVILEASVYLYSWQSEDRKDIVLQIGAEQDRLYTPPQLMLQLYPLAKGSAPCPSGIMVRREVHDEILFEESFRGIYQMYEDQAFLCKIYLYKNVFVSGACNNLYRQRSASLVSSVHSTGQYNVVRKFYLDFFQNYLHEKKIDNPLVNALLKRALLPYHHPTRYWLFYDLPFKIRGKANRVIGKLFKSKLHG